MPCFLLNSPCRASRKDFHTPVEKLQELGMVSNEFFACGAASALKKTMK